MSRNKMDRRLKIAFWIVWAVFMVSGCRQDMHDNPKLKPNREGANRQLPSGTIARGSLALNVSAPTVINPLPGQTLQMTATGPVALGEDGFPFKVTKEILDRGEVGLGQEEVGDVAGDPTAEGVGTAERRGGVCSGTPSLERRMWPMPNATANAPATAASIVTIRRASRVTAPSSAPCATPPTPNARGPDAGSRLGWGRIG